jgi:hypothetical protein
MDVFIVLIEDRHSDPSVEVFRDVTAAIDRAKAVVREYARYPEDIEEGLNGAMERAGWLYYGKFSCENDSVRVEKKTVK